MNAPRHGLARRLGFGVSGQAFSRMVFALNTVALVPVLIRAWGVEGYGQWIALTALASYMSYSNFGVVTTSANEMVMAVGAGDSERARRTFQMSVNLALYIVLPLILVCLGAASLTPLAKLFRLTQMSQAEAWTILALAGGQLFMQTVRGLMVAALYATGSYGFAYYVSGICKFLELLGIAGVVTFLHGTQLNAAEVMTATAALDLTIVAVYARRAAPWARVDLRRFDLAWVRSQAKPAIGFAISNLSTQGVLVQGPRVILSALMGGQAVALYAVYATAMRLMDQLLLMLALPLEIEIAHSVGRDDLPKTYWLITLGTQFSWVLFAGVASFLMLFGPVIFHFWARGRIPFEYGLMALYLVMSSCNQLGRISAHALISTNRLYGPSFLMVGFSLMAMALGGALVPPFGIAGMVLGGIFGELMNSLVVIAALCRWMGKPVSAFFVDMANLAASWNDLGARLRAAGGRFRRFVPSQAE